MGFDGRELRDALGRFATGVCVITVVAETGQALGLTANSFSSVSLDPPLVLWNLQNNSDVYHAFAGPKIFGINVLSAEHEELSNRYAKKGDHQMVEEHYNMGKHGAPVVPGALVSFECELHAAHEGGDHLIIVGRVLDMHSRSSGEPLVFYSGGYRALS